MMTRSRSTTRGPQREAMSSSSVTTWLFFTAVSPAQPLRALTESAFCWQHLESARKTKSGSALTMNSWDSCG